MKFEGEKLQVFASTFCKFLTGTFIDMKFAIFSRQKTLAAE